jgi:hypothetical protein
MEVAMRVVLVPTLIVSILMTANAFAQGPPRTAPCTPARSLTTVRAPASAPAPFLRHQGIVQTVAGGGRAQTRPRQPLSQKEERIDEIVIAVVALAVLLHAG